MKTSTRKLISTLIAVFMFAGFTFAQKTVTVGEPGFADYPSIKQAIDSATVTMNAGETLTINLAAGTKIEPTGNLFLNWGKALNIIVSGAGADQTIITRTGADGVTAITGPPPTDGAGLGGRMWQVGDLSMNGSSMTFKNLTFKYMGNTLAQSTGSIMNFVNEWDNTVTFENVIFDQCVGRALINHNKDKQNFVFDNCLFINCIAAPQANTPANLAQGLIHRGFGGNIIVRNTTFMSNTIINPSTTSGNTGGLIRLASSTGWKSNVLLENITAVNNKYSSTSSDVTRQPMISFRPDVAATAVAFNFNVTLKNITMVGNFRVGKEWDVDLLYEYPDSIRFSTESTGNNFNKALKVKEGVYEDAVIPGTNLSIDNTYTSLNMVMDGQLPRLTPDAHGIGKITYTTTGTNMKLQDPFKIYTYNSIVRISGLNPGDKIEVYTITGGKFSSLVANDAEISFEMPKGIYILRSGNHSQKVLVH